jgi:hypothetical protein
MQPAPLGGTFVLGGTPENMKKLPASVLPRIRFPFSPHSPELGFCTHHFVVFEKGVLENGVVKITAAIASALTQ